MIPKSQPKYQNVLFVAPLTYTHGQGIVSNHVFEIIKNNSKIHIISTHFDSSSRIKKIPYGILILIKLLQKLISLSLTQKSFTVYFTPSRNFFGSNRDFFLLFVIRIILIFKRKSSVNTIAHLHGSELSDFLDYSLYGKILKKLYIQCKTKMIILSSKHKKLCLGKNYNNYIIIRNPIVETDKLRSQLRKKNYYNKKLNICFISNPIKDKGLKESIDWCNAFFKKIDWKLNIIGWTKKDFKEIYKYEIFSEKISFHGILYGDKKYEILKNTHLLLLNSKFEAQPLVVIEALIFECVVILSKIEMLEEFKRFSNIKFFTDQKLSEIILVESLKDKNNLKINSNIAKKIFNFDRFSKKIINTFKTENDIN